jgi:hypothetical protein
MSKPAPMPRPFFEAFVREIAKAFKKDQKVDVSELMNIQGTNKGDAGQGGGRIGNIS